MFSVGLGAAFLLFLLILENLITLLNVLYLVRFYSAEVVGWMNPESEVGARGGPDPVPGHMHAALCPDPVPGCTHGCRVSGPEHRGTVSWTQHFLASSSCARQKMVGAVRQLAQSSLVFGFLGSGGKRSSELNHSLCERKPDRK